MKKYSSILFIEINNFDFFFVVASINEENQFKLLFKNSVPIEGIYNGKINDAKSILDIFKKNIYSIEQKLNIIFKEVVLIVSNFDNSIIEDMVSRGHQINYPVSPIGGGQIILVDNEKNILVGASDYRKDGCAIGF